MQYFMRGETAYPRLPQGVDSDYAYALACDILTTVD
jgi:hypothetical protein